MSLDKYRVQRESAAEQWEAFLHESFIFLHGSFMNVADPSRRLKLFKEFVLVFVEDDRIDAGLAHIHRLEMDARTIDGAVRAMAELDIELDKLKR
jgi:hypothetical protein